MEFLNHRCSQKTRQKTAVTHRQRGFCLLVAELGLTLDRATRPCEGVACFHPAKPEVSVQHVVRLLMATRGCAA